MPTAIPIPITAAFAAPLSLLIVMLGYRVAQQRIRNRIGVGYTEHSGLAKAKSAHENAIDNIPLFLVLMLILELGGTSTALLVGIGCVFLLSRLMHAWGMSQHAGYSPGRRYGIITSWLCIILLAVLNFAGVVLP